MVDYAVPTNALQIFDRKKPAVHHLQSRTGFSCNYQALTLKAG